MNAKSVTNSISNKLFKLAVQLRNAPVPKKITFDPEKRPGFFETGVATRLPKAYFDWNRPFASVPNLHWRDPVEDWYKDPVTGERKRHDRNPIPVYYPPQAQLGLWGGEGWVVGKRKTQPKKPMGGPRFKKTWRPFLRKKTLYSEILNKDFELVVTSRVLDLIDCAYGFDFYILKTPREELNSMVGMVLKRQMLLLLGDPTTLYPDDAAKRQKILHKYRHFIIPREEAEWVGLTPTDAVEKQRRKEAEDNPDRPLKDVFTQELVVELIENDSVIQIDQGTSVESQPFYKSIFRGKSKGTDDGTAV